MDTRNRSREEIFLRYLGLAWDSLWMYSSPSIREQGEIPPSLGEGGKRTRCNAYAGDVIMMSVIR